MDAGSWRPEYLSVDFVVVLVIGISAAMSFARGLVRETVAILSLLAGVLSAFLALGRFREFAREMLPSSWPDYVADGTLLILAFLLVYLACGLVGRILGALIHSVPEIGLLDRIAGAAFGAGRGLLIVIFALLGFQQVFSIAAVPVFITEAQLYPRVEQAARWTQQRLPGLYRQARSAVTLPLPAGSAPANGRNAEPEARDQLPQTQTPETVPPPQDGAADISDILDALDLSDLPDLQDLQDLPELRDLNIFSESSDPPPEESN